MLHRWAWLSLALIVGCGGASPASKTPSEPAADAVDDGVQREMVDEEADDDDDDDDGGGEKGDLQVSSETKPTTVEEAERLLADELTRLDGMLSATQLSSGGCSTACRSLASMKRSVDAICELAGEDDPRCERARSKLDGAKSRVSGASCSC